MILQSIPSLDCRELQLFATVYNNDDPPPSDPPSDPPPSDPPPKSDDPPKPGKVFNQEEVNRLLAEDRRKSQKNREEMINQLTTLRDSVNLSEEEKQGLAKRIEQLQNETLSVQELAKKEKEKIVKEFDREKSKIVSERDSWKTLYSEEKIVREIQDAAIDNKAISAVQIVNFLRPNTRLVEELKDGRPTGKWVTRTTFYDKDEKGEPLTLELSVTEAVKRMSEMTEHWNLFNSGANGGLGSFNLAGVNPGGFRGRKPPKDPIEYKKWREENVRK